MFAHAAPTPPPANAPASSSTATVTTHAASSPSRPSRLRGLSFVRSFNNHHSSSHSQHQPQQNLSPESSPPLLLRASTTPERTTISHRAPPPAAPSTFLNSSRGYLASIAAGNTYLDSHSRSSTSEREEGPFSEGDDASKKMVRRKKVGSSQTQQSLQDAQSHGGSSTTSAVLTGGTTAVSTTGGESKSPEGPGLQGLPVDQMPTIKFIPHHDQRSNKPSLSFAATSRTLPHEDCVIRVGRYSERDVNTNPPVNVPSAAPVGFKSKVVSRRHCEFWCSNGQWYIKDVKSSSGTFLNHIRLSQPSVESRPFPINDGDIVQLGIDFRGGEEQIFRCVKIRIECNRAWQRGLNNFNMSTHKKLRALGATSAQDEESGNRAGATECAICLMPVAPCQSLFVAPCSHVWHFKCIRPILNDHKKYPNFMCPNCRAVANLEEDVDDPGVGAWNAAHEESSDPEEAVRDKGSASGNSKGQKAGEAQNQGSTTEHDITEVMERELRIRSQETQSSGPSGEVGVELDVSTSAPINIPGTASWNQTIPMPPNTLQAASPDTQQREHHEHGEGPLTPRNDAGPFVFDGSAGRSSGRPADPVDGSQ